MNAELMNAKPNLDERFPPDLDTPALLVDLAVVEANVGRLQSEMDARGIALRPHAKTHKSVATARMQLDAGAAGLTVGTLGEAEVFAAAGIRDLFVAYPVWAAGPKAARLRGLHDGADLRVGVDSVPGAERLGAAVAGARRPLAVLVELDPGLHRTGVADPEAAVAVARAARDAGLVVAGVFTHGGHSYRVGNAAAAADDEVRTLEAGAEALRAAGFDVAVVSAGATPTRLAAARGSVNEMRAGTYVFGDRQQVELGAIGAGEAAAVVVSTVVSVAQDRFVIDAGAKSLTKDRADWLAGFGSIVGYPDAVIEKVNDYHGIVSVPAGNALPALGDVVEVVPNHICPVVDLFEGFHVVRDGEIVDRWRVDARGRSG
jgi:D-serine deaminase-like pyridoxal phosphate-dependent protein